MARKLWAFCLLAVCLLGLSGCMFSRADEMYALPKPSEAYVNLQARINQEKGSAEYIAPLNGENCQAIQLVDLDGDDTQEAVVFFRDDASENPLKIVVFRQDDRGNYRVYTRIEGVGSDIESIDYLSMCPSSDFDILVSWQINSSLHSLVAYSVTDGTATEILRSGYGRYLTADLDGDKLDELLLTPIANSADPWRLECYDIGKDQTADMTYAPLSEGSSDISAWSVGLLEDDTPALFATSYFGKDAFVTDVFVLNGKGMQNIALEKGTRRSACTFHSYAGVHPTDINGDGYMEVPAARSIPAFGQSAVDAFWWMDWMCYRADGTSTKAVTTYHSGEGWYLELPEDWDDDFSMCWQSDSILFAKGTESSTKDDEGEDDSINPFLSITTVTGTDQEELTREDKAFTLAMDNSIIYIGQFLPDWNCGLTEDDLISRFHLTNSSRTAANP